MLEEFFIVDVNVLIQFQISDHEPAEKLSSPSLEVYINSGSRFSKSSGDSGIHILFFTSLMSFTCFSSLNCFSEPNSVPISCVGYLRCIS